VKQSLDLLAPVPFDADLHDRNSFSCGVSQLDSFLKTKARKESEANINKTFVLTLKNAPSEIVGYYTLSATHINVTDLPTDLVKKLPRYNHLGVTLLGRFAIAENYIGQGIGGLLLNDVKLRCWLTAQSVASFALIVDVLVGEKGDPTDFYRKYDFTPFPNEPSKFYLSMVTIEKTLRVAGLIS
jgi:GNAT superfamily N-acetyltransferase